MAFLPKTSGVALLFLVIVACAAAAELKTTKEAETAAVDKSVSPKVAVDESVLRPEDPRTHLTSHVDIPIETKNHFNLANLTNPSPNTTKPEPTIPPSNVTSTTPAPVTPTTASPNVTSTTTTAPTPKPSTTVSPNVTTTTTSKPPTTVSPNVTTTTVSPNVTTTTVSPNVTTTTVPPTTAVPPTPTPQQNWSAPSFFGGMVLAFGIVAVGFVGYRFFYLGRGGAYHTL